MKRLYSVLILTIISVSAAFAQSNSGALNLKSIFHEPYIPGNRPSFAGFSPDGKTLYYRWQSQDDERSKTYMTDLKGKDLGEAPDDLQRFYSTSPDGKMLVYQQKGDLVVSDNKFEKSRTIVASKSFDYDATWSADGTQLAYVANGDVWITGIGESYIKQVTGKEGNSPNYNIVDWAGPNLMILNQTDNSDYKEYYFPEYVDTYVKTGASKRGVPSSIISMVDIESGKITKLFSGSGWTSVRVSPTGNFAVTDFTDPAMKKREIRFHDLLNDTSYAVFEDSTEGWMYGRNIEFIPGSDKLMFQSERDGWNHIYTINADGTGMKQHTYGAYDIPYAEFIDENTMVIATSKNDPGDIQLYILDLKTDKQEALTKDEGHRRSFSLGPDKRYVVYAKTYFNQPAELYLTDIKKPGKEIRLTNTVPGSFNDINWQKEDYVRFTGRDGETQLSASILKPAVIDEENGNPVVVFVHGAGSLQNVFKGWSFSYWREYMFNQFLTLNGYYVIEVDYRHSTGYGRKFREDVTNWMGKYETEDIQDGLSYLAANYASVDTSNVGIYGGSYGGFMALYTVSVAPESFDAAAGLRSVTNWANYYYTNPWYTLPRLGTPEADSANYARSSPITYADSLTKPILLLHGLIDNNVGFQDAAQYIERLIQSGNEDFEMMMYPSERHSFQDPDSWYDEYRRIYEFFEKHLK